MTLSSHLADYTVMQCNCSICVVNGYLLVYPNRSDVVFYGDLKNHVHKYQFHTKKKDHWFCLHCGTSLLIDFNGIYENYDVMAVNVSEACSKLGLVLSLTYRLGQLKMSTLLP